MKRVIIAALALAAMAGCAKEKESEGYNGSGTIVNFSSQSITRTNDAGTEWEADDQIGIFSDGFTDDYFNVAYKAKSSAAATDFTLVDGETEILYPNAASGSVTFYAYYPYDSAAIEESKTVDISEQDDLGLIDFMTAAKSVTSYGSDVSLTFEHKLAMVVFDISITAGSGITSLNGLTARLEGIETQGSYCTYGSNQGTLISGSLTAVDDVDLEVSVADDKKSAEITAILHPGDYSTPLLIFALNGTEHSVYFDAELAAGASHTYTLSVGETITGFGDGCDIGGWNPVTGADLTPDIVDIVYNSADDIYEIYSGQGLEAFADLVNGEVNATATTKGGIAFSTTPQLSIDGKLMNDVDLVNVCYYSADGSVSWTPIGDSTNKYAGEFDGNGKEVKNIYIYSSSSSYQGLFGYTTTGAKISNIGVVGGSITGDRSSVGGVVGYANESTVSGCYNTSDVKGDSNVGGVVGGAVNSIVSGCYNTADVEGSGSVGGIMGFAGVGSEVSGCYNTGDVEGSSNNVGGVVGYAFSTISNCYNTGDVKGDYDNVGGVVGSAQESNITSCYSCGAVSGRSYVGGVVGEKYYNSTPLIRYCYYDTDTIGDTNNPSTAVGDTADSTGDDIKTGYAGLSTADMKDSSKLLDYLEDGVSETNWAADTGINNGYPILSWQVSSN